MKTGLINGFKIACTHFYVFVLSSSINLKKKTIYKLLKPIVKPYKPRNKDKKLTQKNEE